MDTCIVLLDFGADVNAVSKLGNKVSAVLIIKTQIIEELSLLTNICFLVFLHTIYFYNLVHVLLLSRWYALEVMPLIQFKLLNNYNNNDNDSNDDNNFMSLKNFHSFPCDHNLK